MYKIMLVDDEAEVRESILLQISKSSCISRKCSICNAEYRLDFSYGEATKEDGH